MHELLVIHWLASWVAIFIRIASWVMDRWRVSWFLWLFYRSTIHHNLIVAGLKWSVVHCPPPPPTTVMQEKCTQTTAAAHHHTLSQEQKKNIYTTFARDSEN